MTTTDPTITIAGLRAQVESLQVANRESIAMWTEAVEDFDELAAQADGLTAERDALAAQLAEVRAELAKAPKVCAIHSYEHGPGPCMTCGAWPPGTRELIAACQTRIAGLESAANERSAEVARLTAQLEAARKVIDENRAHAEGFARDLAIAIRERDEERATVARLTARVAELEARPALDVGRLAAALNQCELGPRASDIMRHLGPVTLPAQDQAEELTQAIHGTPREEVNPAMWRGMVERTRSALASLGAPPTSPPAARPVFAGVSEQSLANTAATAHRECRDCNPWMAVARAVLARLEVSLVAPGELSAVANELLCRDGGGLSVAELVGKSLSVIAERRAAGIPVTPEVGK